MPADIARSADRLFTGIRQLVSPRGWFAARGAAMSELDIIDDAAMAVTGGMITWIGRASDWTGRAAEDIDVGGRAVVPGLIDPHTHVVWAGDRLADFEARCAGVPYEEILVRGGGIRRSVRDTASTDVDTLVSLAEPRIVALIASGATTIEIKTGYGGTAEAEFASLEAIARLGDRVPAKLVATLLIHVPPRDPAERTDFLAMVTGSLIPEAAGRRLATAVDVFIEREAFTLDEARSIFEAAHDAHLPVKAHVDQFHAIGGLELALEYGAISVDHLEASGAAQVQALAASSAVGVVLPGVTLHLGLHAAPARAMIDAGAAIAVATDLNPGSSPLFSTQLAMALGVRLNGLTPAEALTAATANAAAALGRQDVGRLREGQCADFLVLGSADWRDLPYALGGSPVERVFIGGRRMYP